MKKTLFVIGTAIVLCAVLFCAKFVETIVQESPTQEQETVFPITGTQSPALKKMSGTTFIGSVFYYKDTEREVKVPIKDATVLVQYWDGPDYTDDTGNAPPEKCLAEEWMKTDAEGKYTVTLPDNLISKAELHIKVMAEHPKYIHYGSYTLPVAEAIALEKTGKFGEFALSSATQVKGTVLSPEGKPIAGALVKALSWYPYTEWGGDPDERDFFYGTTDEQGCFDVKVEMVPPKYDFLIWVIAKDYAPVLKEFDTLPSEAGTFKLETGVPVKGRLLDSEGMPLANVWINVIGNESSPRFYSSAYDIWRSACTNENGEFETEPFSPGDYMLVSSCSPEDLLVLYDGWSYTDIQEEGIKTLEQCKREAVPPFVVSFKNLPDVYLKRDISLKTTGNTPLEIRPDEMTTIRFRVTDSQGKPYTEPLYLSVKGEIHGNNWSVYYGSAPHDEPFRTDPQGNGTLLVPVGLEHAIFRCGQEKYGTKPIQFRMSSNAPWKTDWCIEWTKIEKEITPFDIRALKPTILNVAVVDEAGHSLGHPPLWFEYANKDLFKNDDHGGFGYKQYFGRRVGTENQNRGGYRIHRQFFPVLPDETFTVTFNGSGYIPVSQTLTLAEGETKTINMVPKK